MNGYGIHIWPDGRKYIGEYVDDRKEGRGTYEWKQEKKIYKG